MKFVRFSLILLLLGTIGLPSSFAEVPGDKEIHLVTTMYAERPHLMNVAIEQFERENEGWTVHDKNFEGEIVDEKIMLALMAKEPGMDILPVDSGTFFVYANKGILADLSKEAGFDQNIADWLDIAPVLSREDKLLCVSSYLAPTLWKWNGALADKLAIPKPSESWTWQDFFHIASAARQDIDGDGKPDTYAYAVQGPDYISDFFLQYTAMHKDYAGQYARFDTPEFRGLLRQFGAAWQEGLIGDYSLTPPLSPDNVLIWDDFDPSSPPKASNMLMPLVEGARCQPLILLNGYGVNDSSPVKEKAAALLRLFSSKQVISQMDDISPLILRDLERLPLYDDIFTQFSNMPEAYIKTYRQGLSLGVLRDYQNDVEDVSVDMLWRYFHGEVTEDDVVNALERISRMMAGE